MHYITFVLLLLTASCTSLKETPAETTQNLDEPAIIFVNYKAIKTSEKDVEIQLINMIPAKGKLKMNERQPKDFGDQDLKYIQMTKNSVRLDSGYIQNPLVKDVEYTDSDGSLAMKRIELDSAEFSIRFQKVPRAVLVVIEKADKQGNQLLKTNF